MSWSIWPLLKRIVLLPTEQKRNGKHLQGLQLHNRQDIGWFRVTPLELRLEAICLADGWLDLPNKPNSTDHRCHKINNNHGKVHDRAFHQLLQETAIIVVSIVEARLILSRTALNLGNLSKGRHLIRTTRKKAGGKWCRSVKGG
jgi:hypothetical protein